MHILRPLHVNLLRAVNSPNERALMRFLFAGRKPGTLGDVAISYAEHKSNKTSHRLRRTSFVRGG